jgi:1-deoxy-D-xylulose-5-phosphate synthase
MMILPERAFDVGIAEQHAVTLSWNGDPRYGCFLHTNFYKGRPGDSRRSHTKLTRYFCLDRAGPVGEEEPITAF